MIRRILCGSHAANNSWLFHSTRELAKNTFEIRADPKSDPGFKNLFKRDKKIVTDFLNDSLDEGHILSVKFCDGELIRRNKLAKGGFTDILCELKDGRTIIVEMQVQNKGDFQKRAQFYASHVYSNQLLRGSSYNKLRPIIMVTVANYNIFPPQEVPNFYSKHVIRNNQTGNNDLRDLKWIFIELAKFKKPMEDIDHGLDIWSYFLKHASVLTPGDITKLSEKKALISTASETLDTSKWTKADRLAYTRDVVYANDEASQNLEVRVNIAKKMLARGESVDSICEITELKREDFE